MKVRPEDLGVLGEATALAEFSPTNKIITSGEHDVVRETETDVPSPVPPDTLPSRESVVVVVELKFAVSVIGALMVIEPGLERLVKEPVPVPVQPPNMNPVFAEAEIDTAVFASYHPVSPEILGAVVAPSQ